jgi:hypothetical protein
MLARTDLVGSDAVAEHLGARLARNPCISRDADNGRNCRGMQYAVTLTEGLDRVCMTQGPSAHRGRPGIAGSVQKFAQSAPGILAEARCRRRGLAAADARQRIRRVRISDLESIRRSGRRDRRPRAQM